MGWDQTFLQDAVNQCTNLTGEIEDCPLFTIQDASTYGNCNITLPSALVSENVVGPIPTLPGNPAIASGPGYASGTDAGQAPVTATANPVPTPGALFAAVTSASSAVAAAAVASPSTTPPPAAAAASVSSESFFSTDYSTSGLVVQEVLWVEEVVTETATAAQTGTLMKRSVPGRDGHLRKHHRRAGLGL
jgi:hypothetical protein